MAEAVCCIIVDVVVKAFGIIRGKVNRVVDILCEERASVSVIASVHSGISV